MSETLMTSGAPLLPPPLSAPKASTVVLVLTDVHGSTKLWQEESEACAPGRDSGSR